MHPALGPYLEGVRLTGDVPTDVLALLEHHGRTITAEHVPRVAAEVRRIALLSGLDPAAAELGGWLHDVSAAVPSDEMLGLARALGIGVLPEEEVAPFIVHQRLSVEFARDVFGVRDTGVLSAVGCHTTLKAGATALDKALFVADKLEWDQAGEPPYKAGLLAALDISLDEAAAYFVRYLWDRRETLFVVHPWLRDAHKDLARSRAGSS